MSTTTVVRYTTKPEHADENERLVGEVFAALARLQPAGLRYRSVRLDDGVSFVHVAEVDGENPLATLPEFQAFTADIASRCVEGPTPTAGRSIGSYDPVG